MKSLAGTLAAPFPYFGGKSLACDNILCLFDWMVALSDRELELTLTPPPAQTRKGDPWRDEELALVRWGLEQGETEAFIRRKLQVRGFNRSEAAIDSQISIMRDAESPDTPPV